MFDSFDRVLRFYTLFHGTFRICIFSVLSRGTLMVLLLRLADCCLGLTVKVPKGPSQGLRLNI